MRRPLGVKRFVSLVIFFSTLPAETLGRTSSTITVCDPASWQCLRRFLRQHARCEPGGHNWPKDGSGKHQHEHHIEQSNINKALA